MARCPPGVICLESTVLVLAVFVALSVTYFAYQQRQSHAEQTVMVEENVLSAPLNTTFPGFPEVSVPVMTSTYAAPAIPPPPNPVFYGNRSQIPGRGPYQQVGFLTGAGGSILPLMGRPLAPGRDIWQYYTASDRGYGVQLPVRKDGKSCSGEYGCTSLWNRDAVFVEGYGRKFSVTMYERDGIPYSPYI